MSLDAQEVADAYGLGRASVLTEPVARGELGEVRRLETERGTYAVKEELEARPVEEAETSTAYHHACWEAGVPCPEPLRTTAGRFVAHLDREQVRLYEWVDLDDPDPGLDPAAVGDLVARLHAVDHPWPTSAVDPWFEAPVGSREWRAVLKAARGAGAPYAQRLAELLPGLLEVEGILTPMPPRQVCHLDLWADNVRRNAVGGLCVFDFDNAGPGDPAREIAMVVVEFGRGDPDRQRSVYDAYRDAGGPGRVTGREDFALTVAQLHHIGHRHLRMWPAAHDSEGRARSLAGIEEFLGEPFLLAEVDAALGALT